MRRTARKRPSGVRRAVTSAGSSTARGPSAAATRSGSQLFAIRTGRTVDSYPALSATGDLVIGSDNGYLYSIGR